MSRNWLALFFDRKLSKFNRDYQFAPPPLISLNILNNFVAVTKRDQMHTRNLNNPALQALLASKVREKSWIKVRKNLLRDEGTTFLFSSENNKDDLYYPHQRCSSFHNTIRERNNKLRKSQNLFESDSKIQNFSLNSANVIYGSWVN